MRGTVRRRTLIVVAVSLTGLVAAGGIAYATIPDSAKVYTACMLKNVGTIRMIDTSLPAGNLAGHCTALEIQISWNQQGQVGALGPAGSAGAKGATGAAGPQGQKGDTGAQGVKGDIGLTGATGLQGATGAAGKDGLAGPAGADGKDGLAGPAGADGAAGTDGAQGPAGEQGPAGPPGTGSGALALQNITSVLSPSSDQAGSGPDDWHHVLVGPLNEWQVVLRASCSVGYVVLDGSITGHTGGPNPQIETLVYAAEILPDSSGLVISITTKSQGGGGGRVPLRSELPEVTTTMRCIGPA